MSTRGACNTKKNTIKTNNKVNCKQGRSLTSRTRDHPCCNFGKGRPICDHEDNSSGNSNNDHGKVTHIGPSAIPLSAAQPKKHHFSTFCAETQPIIGNGCKVNVY